MSHDRVPQPYTLSEPLDYEDARQAGKELARMRQEAREVYEKHLREAAEKTSEYRKALAMAFVSAEGDTAAAREADARKRAAPQEQARMIADGMVKAAQQRLEELDAHRATFHRLVEWSAMLDPTVAEIRAQRRNDG